MTEITRVPIQRIAQGSLTRLWLGVIVAIVLGAGVAWSTLPASVQVTEIRAGAGTSPDLEDIVFVRYVGKLPDGEEFERSPDAPAPVPNVFPEGVPLPLEGMIPGFRDGLAQMQKGGKYELFIPADLAYGDAPPAGSGIAPGTDLTFEVELIDFMTEAEVERLLGVMR